MMSITKFTVFVGGMAASAVFIGVFFTMPVISDTVIDPITAFAFGGSGDGGCCGGGGVGNGGDRGDTTGRGDGPQDRPQPKSPSCDAFSVTPNTLPHTGGSVTISWKTTNLSGVFITPGVGLVGKGDGSVTVQVNKDTNFALYTLDNDGEKGSKCKDAVVKLKAKPPVVKPASCDAFTASPSQVPYNGGNVKLTWNTTNATSVSINNGIGNVAGDGSLTVHVDAPKTFTLTANGKGGNDNCQVKVTVKPKPQPKLPSCDALTASRTSLPHTGGNVTLTWNTTNATDVRLNNGVGSVAGDGSRTVFVDGTTTFVLTAANTSGSDQCQVKINVKDTPEDKHPSCDSFSVSPNRLSHNGGNVTLNWNTTNASNVRINNGIGNVAGDGSTTVFVDNDTTFVLTASDSNDSVNCSASVTLKDKPQDNLSCDLFDSNKSTVEEDEDFKLFWETTGADTVRINNGIGNVADDGSITTSINDDTTFTLTAENDDGDEVTCKTTVRVDEDEDEDDDDKLRCELDISDDKIEEGDKVTLEWDNEGADDILLEDDHGHVLVDTDDGDNYDEESDEITVKPTKDTEYTLTVYQNGKKRTCEVDVEVEEEDDEITVVKHKDQLPLVAGITLTQVPYTGFEAGPLLTTLFYALLALWGTAVAYILVVKRGSVFGFALAGNTPVQEDLTPFANTAYEPVYSYAPAPTAATEYTPVVGYAALAGDEAVEAEVAPEEETSTDAIETRAHDARVLLSTDALNFIAAQDSSLEDQFQLLDAVIANAKAMFPSENGWMVINKERMLQLLG